MRPWLREGLVLAALVLGGCPKPAPIPEPTVYRELLDESARHWWVRAQVAADRGDLPEAQRALGWLTRLDASALAWAQVGDLRARLGDNPGAILAYERALEADPDHPQASLGLARLIRATDPDRALALLRHIADMAMAAGRAADVADQKQALSTGFSVSLDHRPSEAPGWYDQWLAQGLPGDDPLRTHAAVLLGRWADVEADLVARFDDGRFDLADSDHALALSERGCRRFALWRRIRFAGWDERPAPWPQRALAVALAAGDGPWAAQLAGIVGPVEPTSEGACPVPPRPAPRSTSCEDRPALLAYLELRPGDGPLLDALAKAHDACGDPARARSLSVLARRLAP